PLIMPAEQREAGLLRQFLRNLLVKETTLRRQINNRPTLINLFNRSENRLRLHYHTSPATIGIIIDYMMTVPGCITNIGWRHAQQFTFLGTFKNALGERSLEHSGEECEDIKMHITIHLSGLSAMIGACYPCRSLV